MDLTSEQGQKIIEITREIDFIPLIGMAYRGLGSRLDEDVYGLRLLAGSVIELVFCS